MAAEEIKLLVRRFFEEMNKGKAAAMAIIDELYATDIVYHRGTGRDTRGLEDSSGLKDKQPMSISYDMFPDLHFALDDIVVEGDKVATRWTMTGTHKGELRDISMTTWVITVDRIADGKFVEEWERYDTLGFMQQLGLLPRR